MVRAGEPTERGLTMRVYEVLADGTQRDVEPPEHTYGSRPIPVPPRRPRCYGEPEPGASDS